MLKLRRKSQKNTKAFTSRLFDEKSFYKTFIKDLLNAKEEVIIESPFITASRMKSLTPIIKKLLRREIKMYVITRDPSEHEKPYASQSEAEIQQFEALGIQALICSGKHHRKLSIIDREILWEGSLNILSQTRSREIMRRIDDKETTMEMFNYLKLEKFL